MEIILLCLAILCLTYYIICAMYAGIGSSFIFAWLIAAISLFTVFQIRILEKNDVIHIAFWLKTVFWCVIFCGVVLFAAIEILIIRNMANTKKEPCDYIIVLGCQIRGDKITRSLKNRLNVACEYAEAYPEAVIIVSGGQGNGENTTEAYAMKKYLAEHGIEENRIIEEGQSTNTKENMMMSKKIIEGQNSDFDFESRPVAVVTNNFHVARSLLIAKSAGISKACGIGAPSDNILLANYMVREAIAIVKDFLFGNIYSIL